MLSAAATQDEQQQQRELFGAGSASEPLVDGSRDGALSRAADGTLLIESIDQFTEGVRAALASAIAQQRFTRVGESEPVSLRARVVATALSVGEANLSGAECEAVSVAALADRTEDVLPLAAHFLAQFTATDGTELVGFTNDARRWLLEEQWLGNVEELAERIRQAVRLAGDGAISAEALMLASEGDEVPSFKEAKRAFETRYVEGLLRRCNGNISRAARLAKKDRKDFYDVIRRTGVDPAQFRP